MTNFEKTFELLENLNLNWTVEKELLNRQDGTPTDTYGLFRKDNGHQLHRGVGEGYQVYQNATMIEDLVDLAGDRLKLDNLSQIKGGFLQGGKKVHISMPIKMSDIGVNDQIKRYLTFTNAHDGSSSIGLGFSNQVVSCSNTFFAVAKQLNRVTHTASMMDNINNIKMNLEIALQQEEELMETFRKMTTIPVGRAFTEDFVDSLLGIKHTPEEDISTRAKNKKEAILTDIESEMNEKGDNKWGLFNGVTYYTNHTQPKENQSVEDNVMRGNGMTLNNRALKMLTANNF